MQVQSSWTVLTRESNVLLLRSFQIIHEVRMTKVSKALRPTLVSFLREEVHQGARSKHRPFGVSECHRSLCKTRYQICLANEQLSNKCEIDSDSWAQRAQRSSSCKLCRFLLSAVQQRSWRTSQTKNLHFPGACVFFKHLAPGTSYCPMKKARYAEAVEKHWSLVHFHKNLSSESGLNWTALVASQTSKKFRMTCTVRAPEISSTHLLFSSPCATVLHFTILGPTALNRQGASSWMHLPCIHRSDQKRARWPLPISTETETWRTVGVGFFEPKPSHSQGKTKELQVQKYRARPA